MTAPRSRYVALLGREIHYVEWGEDRAPPVVMWHGLARTGRDFDELAAALAPTYHVFCPDMIGRGLSQWSPDPDREYSLGFYRDIATAFADALALGAFRWVGTSMGGAIGIKAAASTLAGRVTHLVLNDNGPKLAEAAIARIRTYAGNPAAFATMSELEAYFRTVYKPFGALTDAQWRRLAETSARRLPDGRVTPHYDPAMARQFTLHPGDYDLWPDYDRIAAKTLCLRGAESDLLLAEVAEAMTRRGPNCRLVTVPGVGHAPALNVPDQIGVVADFLAS
jgi:pimeloyl-ACP methyl ester carboxylesterase